MSKYFARVQVDGETIVGLTELTVPIAAKCSVCGKEIMVCPRPYERILALACSEGCRGNDKFWHETRTAVSPLENPPKKTVTKGEEEAKTPVNTSVESKTIEDLLRLIPHDEKGIGGDKLRTALGIDQEEYKELIKEAVNKKLVVVCRGRGGIVKIVG